MALNLRRRSNQASNVSDEPLGNDRFPLSVSLPAVLADGSDREFRQLIHQMVLAEGRLGDIRKAIAAQVGASATQYTMLMAVVRLQGSHGVAIGGLADYLEVTGPHVTDEVNKLAAMGFVRKSMNPKDKRSVLVQLTAEGRKRLMRAFDFIRNVNDILFAEVTAEEFKVLVRFQRKFMRNTNLALEWIERRPNSISRVSDR
jgi:MarR family transcriptional regulator, organic hydroperoxide resistance regulator